VVFRVFRGSFPFFRKNTKLGEGSKNERKSANSAFLWSASVAAGDSRFTSKWNIPSFTPLPGITAL